jgi:hypothetical protein
MKTSFPPWLSERHKAAIHLRELHRCKFREIGQKLGVSTCRAHELYKQGVSRREHAPECFHGLTCRTVHILERLCLSNREEVLAAVVSGRLTPKRGPRNHGKQTQIEILSWLGLLKV